MNTRNKYMLIVVLVGLLAVTAAAILPGLLRSPETPEEEYRPMRQILPQPPTTKIAVAAVRNIDKELDDDEMVLGVVIGDEARAYPLSTLSATPATKVINDTLGRKPIAVTWCDMSHSAVVYARALDGSTLTLGVDGRIWKENMVMYDETTRTQWCQFLGLAKFGSLKDRRLEALPSVVTDWQSWRAVYPDGTVMVAKRHRVSFRRETYAKADYVLGIATDGERKTWRLDDLRMSLTLNDTLDGLPVAAVYVPEHGTARLFGCVVDKQR